MTLVNDIEMAIKRARASFRASYNKGHKVDEDTMIAKAAIDVVERRLLSRAIEFYDIIFDAEASTKVEVIKTAWQAAKESSI